MAQETGKGTFHQQTELFLRNWICAGNAANYTTRGRAYNPWSGACAGAGPEPPHMVEAGQGRMLACSSRGHPGGLE